MASSRKNTVFDASGENLSAEQLDVITEALLETGLLRREDDGSVTPVMAGEGEKYISLEVDDDGNLVSAEILEDWEIPPEMKTQ